MVLCSEGQKAEAFILDNQVAMGKYHLATSSAMMANHYSSHAQSEEEIAKAIQRQENSAAGILYHLKSQHGPLGSELVMTKDVIGIVASLGKVGDDNLSRLISEYLGMEVMSAVVCKTYAGVKELEVYDRGGSIDKSLGLHGVGNCLGRSLDSRYLVICLEQLSPYRGELMPGDPQRRLNLMKPRLPNGELPAGFLGFAVNMITLENLSFHYVTTSGQGLRETLFYNLLFHLQVYRTRLEMLQALPLITNGALSLDGGMIKSTGIFSFGKQEEVSLKFARSSGMLLPEKYFEMGRQIDEMTKRKEMILAAIRREQILLEQSKTNYAVLRGQALQYAADISSIMAQALIHGFVDEETDVYSSETESDSETTETGALSAETGPLSAVDHML